MGVRGLRSAFERFGHLLGPICALILLDVPAAEAQTRFKETAFNENLRSAVPHAGESAIGLVAQGPSGDRFGSLYVRTPMRIAGQVCVSVTSIDGRYTARSSYKVNAAPGDVFILNFPTAKLERAVRYASSDLALSVRVGCNAASKMLIASWAQPGATGRIGLAVNAGAGTSAFLIDRGRKDCEDLAETRADVDSASISHICWLGTDRLTQGGDILIFRDTPAGRISEIIFPIAAAAGW